MPDADLSRLAAVLRAECVRQGLTHAELGTRSGLPQPTVSRVLGGARSPAWDTLAALLGGLGRSLSWLDRQLRADSG